MKLFFSKSTLATVYSHVLSRYSNGASLNSLLLYCVYSVGVISFNELYPLYTSTTPHEGESETCVTTTGYTACYKDVTFGMCHSFWTVCEVLCRRSRGEKHSSRSKYCRKQVYRVTTRVLVGLAFFSLKIWMESFPKCVLGSSSATIPLENSTM